MGAGIIHALKKYLAESEKRKEINNVARVMYGKNKKQKIKESKKRLHTLY
ncbi:MAG: hypothetical protein ACOCW2_04945 [Chitinivibrionales bacterium]